MKVTVLVTYSRPEYLDLVRENLANLELGDNECDLLVMDDSNNPQEFDFDGKYTSVMAVPVGRGKPVTSNIAQIRSRIAEVRNLSKQYVSGDFVFSFEDDTEVPKDALLRLLENYHNLTLKSVKGSVNVGLISGIQVGRHSARMIGAWTVDSYQFPDEATTFGMKDVVTPLAEVDATGFYCFLTPAHLYKSAKFGWYEPFGPDVWYGLWLRTKGFTNYVDQSLICPHRGKGRVYVPDDETIKLRVYKKRGRWVNEPVKKEV